jgi:hypothetical protein
MAEGEYCSSVFVLTEEEEQIFGFTRRESWIVNDVNPRLTSPNE